MTYLEKAKAEHMEEIKEATLTGEDMDIIRLLCPVKYFPDAGEPCRNGITYYADQMKTGKCRECWNREVK